MFCLVLYTYFLLKKTILKVQRENLQCWLKIMAQTTNLAEEYHLLGTRKLFLGLKVEKQLQTKTKYLFG